MTLRSLLSIRRTTALLLPLLTAAVMAGNPAGLSDADWAGLRAAHDARRHSIQPADDQPGVWRTDNPGQQWAVEFDARGFLAKPRDGAWTWGLELRSYGRDDSQTEVHGTTDGHAQGQRFSRRRDECVEEWWVNDARGLEHGFILHQRPPGEAELSLHLDTRGGLRPKVLTGAQGLAFQNESGSSVVHYTGLKVWDAGGQVLPARFEPEGASGVRLHVQDRGARYPVTIDPVAQQLFLKAPITDRAHRFGTAVAMHGDTVVIGEPGAGPLSGSTGYTTGVVHVYVRTAGVWSHQAMLTTAALAGISNRGFAHDFGSSVGIHGNTVVVGAPGEDSSSAGVDSVPEVVFPYIGVDSGAAYVFVRNPQNNQWSQQAYLKASTATPNDQFGSAVSVNGDTVVVGAPRNSSAVSVFVRDASNQWSQQDYVRANNYDWSDTFGTSVSISGDTLIVGAPHEDSDTTGINSTPSDPSINHNSGAAYVFERNGTTWSQQAYLKAANSGSGDLFGFSVALDGATAVVGAYKEDSNVAGVNSIPSDPSSDFDAGAAYVFVRTGSTWSQQAYLKASNPGGFDWFGEKVAVSGNTVVVGARLEDSNTTGVDSTPSDPNQSFESGAAYVYTRTTGVWTQQAYLKASNTGNGDWFGSAVAVSGESVIVGAPEEDSSTTGFNPVPNNTFNAAGAAYFFTGAGPVSPALAQFNAAIAAAGLSGPNADPAATPFGDGVSNLLKYAFNMNLSGPDSHQQAPGGPAGGLPVITTVPAAAPNQLATLRFEFVRRTGSGLIYTPQKSASLNNPAAWAPLTDTPTETPIDANWTRVVYEEQVDPAVLLLCFGRVQVTVP